MTYSKRLKEAEKLNMVYNESKKITVLQSWTYLCCLLDKAKPKELMEIKSNKKVILKSMFLYIAYIDLFFT